MVIHLNGTRCEIPSCWEEVTTAQYQRMVSEWEPEKEIYERDFFKLFCILTGKDFKSYVGTTENEVTIYNAVRWVMDQQFMFADKHPKYLDVAGKIIAVPEDLGLLSIGQMIQLRQLLDKSKYLEENLSKACAICLQPVHDEGKFDYRRAMELEPVFAQMPVYLMRPIGFFLLRVVLPAGRQPAKLWLRGLTNLVRKCAGTLQRWLRSIGLPPMMT